MGKNGLGTFRAFYNVAAFAKFRKENLKNT